MNMETNKIERIRSIAYVLQSRVIAVVLLLSIFATTVFAAFSASYTVTIVDDGVKSQIVTTRTEPVDILNQVQKNLDTMDKIDLSDFESGKGGKIVVSRAKNIHIEYCGQIKSAIVYSQTVKKAIAEAGYTLADGDKINYPLDTQVEDGMVITIAVLKSIQIIADGQTIITGVNAGTVADTLALNGIELGGEDFVTPELTAAVEADMVITVNRVTVAQVTEKQAIPFATSTVKSADLDKGAVQIQTNGVNGEKSIDYSVKYVNGVEQERTVLGENITVQPVNQVKVIGTKTAAPVQVAVTAAVINPSRSWNGITEGALINGNASHYCACGVCGSGKGVTASGVKVWNGMDDPHIVACNWLPLGTVVRVNGVEYTVSDRGGKSLSSKGRLDVFTPAGHQACKQLGRKNITIEIVRLAKTN